INFEDFPLCRKELKPGWGEANEKAREAYLRSGVVPLDYPDPVAADWPDLLAIVEAKVKPERLAQNDSYGQQYWWRFLRTRPEMRGAIESLSRVMVCARIGNAFAFVFLPKSVLPNEKTVIFAFDTALHFTCMQSRIHEGWTRFFSSTLKDDLQYTPSDCFENFPFPEVLPADSGKEYYSYREELMQAMGTGLTKIYNRFHDPNQRDERISVLRVLHDRMDRAVLDAYGWQDIQPVCDFYPEFDEEEDEAEGRARKKKYRYRWSDEVRDEVLARLLALNSERAAEEAPPITFLAPVEPKKPRGQKKTKTTTNSKQLTLGASE
ncbi:MAG: hypothetical protein JNK87_42825, partial [Bryobacterales bacterium]|nr:hypothetical protein [Bryobacterales bacterium]